MQFSLEMFSRTRSFLKHLWDQANKDRVFDGAAALAFYWMLAIFPAAIFLIALIPYLPIDNLYEAIMGFLSESLPGDAAMMFQGVVQQITQQRQGQLLSLGALLALWSASNGMYAVMRQLNVTYHVPEARDFFRARATAVGLTLLYGVVLLATFALVIFGGVLQDWAAGVLGWNPPLQWFFSVVRYLIIAAGLFFAFAATYSWAPNRKRRFELFTLSNTVGVVLLIAASLGFNFYVRNFADFNATYGAIGGAILFMFYLYVLGLVVLVGGEIDSIFEEKRREKHREQDQRRTSPPRPLRKIVNIR